MLSLLCASFVRIGLSVPELIHLPDPPIMGVVTQSCTRTGQLNLSANIVNIVSVVCSTHVQHAQLKYLKTCTW